MFLVLPEFKFQLGKNAFYFRVDAGGSGCMSYQVSDPSVAAVDISEGKAMKALVAPLKPGSVVIEASDVCLLPQSHVNITLYFVDAAQIQLKGLLLR
jgi:hypothetical protein